jgi:antitoxin (DNA-binding transcriptional repressor) of toxin-antitoxin stability system
MDGGEEIVSTRGEPAVGLVPAKQGAGFVSLAGAWQGRVAISDDFDELPADLAESLGIEF